MSHEAVIIIRLLTGAVQAMQTLLAMREEDESLSDAERLRRRDERRERLRAASQELQRLGAEAEEALAAAVEQS